MIAGDSVLLADRYSLHVTRRAEELSAGGGPAGSSGLPDAAVIGAGTRGYRIQHALCHGDQRLKNQLENASLWLGVLLGEVCLTSTIFFQHPKKQKKGATVFSVWGLCL